MKEIIVRLSPLKICDTYHSYLIGIINKFCCCRRRIFAFAEFYRWQFIEKLKVPATFHWKLKPWYPLWAVEIGEIKTKLVLYDGVPSSWSAQNFIRGGGGVGGGRGKGQLRLERAQTLIFFVFKKISHPYLSVMLDQYWIIKNYILDFWMTLFLIMSLLKVMSHLLGCCFIAFLACTRLK